MLIRVVTLLIIFTASHGFSNNLRCSILFKSDFLKLQSPSKKQSHLFSQLPLAERAHLLLSKVPILQGDVAKILTDSRTPNWLLNLFNDALIKDDLQVFDFNQTVKKRHGWKNGDAFAVAKSNSFNVIPSKTKDATNSRYPEIFNNLITETIESLKSASKKDNVKAQFTAPQYLVFIEDKKPYLGRSNSLLFLVHELAHVRFYRFFDQHIETLVGKFPDELLFKDSKGQIHISQDLYDYLNERHSFEYEFRMLQFLKKFHSNNLMSGVPDFWNFEIAMNQYDAFTIRRIAKAVTRIYNLDDASLIDFHNQSLNDLLNYPLVQ